MDVQSPWCVPILAVALAAGLPLVGLAADSAAAPQPYYSYPRTAPTYQLPDNPHPNLDQLIAGLQKQSQSAPNSADVWYQLGLSYAANHQNELAASALKTAAKLKPDSVDIWMNLGYALTDQFSVTEVDEPFRTAHRLAPDDEMVTYQFAIALMREHRFDECRELLDEAQDAHPRSGLLMGAVGALHMVQKEFDGALLSYQRATQLDPTLVPSWISMATCLAVMHRYPEAVDALTAALNLDPKNEKAWGYLVSCYKQLNDLPGGLVKVKQISDAHPDSVQGLATLGFMQDSTGDQDDAITTLSKALQMDPANVTAWNGIGMAYIHQATQPDKPVHPDKATDAFNHALKIDPNNHIAWNNLGYGELLQGQIDAAIGSFRRSLQSNPRYTTAMVNLINAYAQKGQKELALETCRNLEQYDPATAEQIEAKISAAP